MRDGELRPYTGSRSLPDLLSFSKRMTEAAVTPLSPTADATALLSPARPTIFLLLTADSSSDPAFDRVAHQLQGTTSFYHLPAPSDLVLSALSLNPSSLPVVVYLTKGVAGPERYSGALSSAELRKWVEARRMPLISSLSETTFDELTTDPRALALLVGDESGNVLKTYTDALYATAAKHKASVVLATVNVDKYRKWISQFLDTNATQLPALVAFHPYPDAVHRPDAQPQSVKQVIAMIADIAEGRRSAVNSMPWYSPARYLRVVQRLLSGFSEWQLVAGVIVLSTAAFGVIAWLTMAGPSGVDARDGARKEGDAAPQPAPARETVKASAVDLREKVKQAAQVVEAEQQSAGAALHEADDADADDEDDDTDGQSPAASTAVPRKTRTRKD